MTEMKLVVNKCFGGFSISRECAQRMAELGSKEAKEELNGKDPFFGFDYFRDDPLLVQAVEELGERASGPLADLKIVEIPDDVEWQIEEYDGQEWVAEKHRTW